jgi:iron complex transport system ATP-binding protein
MTGPHADPARRQPLAAQQSSAAAQRFSATAQQSSTVTQQSSAAAQQSSAATQQPSAAAEQSSAAAQQSAATQQPGYGVIDTIGLELGSVDRCLVRALDWQCRVGERWCLIGRNAVGKTTLLRALSGLRVPGREGAIRWRGKHQRDWTPDAAASWRAFMHQQVQDRFSIRVDALLALSVCVEGVRDLRNTVERLDVAHLMARDVMQLSGGERQRVALAQCAMQGAPLMLLDEPVAFQDPAHQAYIARWLVESSATLPSALVMSAHDVNWIARVATHVLALGGDGGWEAGTVASMLTPDKLEAVYGCRWVRAGDALLIDE